LLFRIKMQYNKIRRLAILLQGPSGCGKTAIACELALKAEFQFVSVISPEDVIGLREQEKCLKINQIFENAYKSETSIVILDDLEQLLGYVKIIPRFQSLALQTIQILCRKNPPSDRSIVIIATSVNDILEDLKLEELFDVSKKIPLISSPSQLKHLVNSMELEVDYYNLGMISSYFKTHKMGKCLIFLTRKQSKQF